MNMSTGDIIITCSFCSTQYYQVNGHACSFKRPQWLPHETAGTINNYALNDRLARVERKLDELTRLLGIWVEDTQAD